jgi:uncharacterized protein (TIRG00374 family)
MTTHHGEGKKRLKHFLVGSAGVLLGGMFLWLATRNMDRTVVETTLRQADVAWLIIGVIFYLLSIGLRCLRWGILLRATDDVKWRHAAEALMTGYAANFVLPGRIGEVFRADYAYRVFKMSRFASFGTIIVERVCDGIALVCALWISVAWILYMQFALVVTSWIFAVGAVSSALFGVVVIFIVVSQRVQLRRFGIGDFFAKRWDLLVGGMSSVLRGNTTAVLSCSIGILVLDTLTLAGIVRCFGVSLLPSQNLMLLALASLSTLLPTAPGFVGTYQLVFANVLHMFGYQQTIGIIAATAVQIFCFGTVTIVGGFVLLSRSGITVWRANRSASPEDHSQR